MTSYPLSICIPSNKPYQSSRASISSAINFCDLTSSELMVSDNSCDLNKSNFWESIKLDYFNYKSNAPIDGVANWYNAQENSQGLYTCMLSDDDLILNIDNPLVDYRDLYNNGIFGIKPVTKLWNEKIGTYKTNDFSITDETAIQRMHTYYTKANGNNTTLFSFFNSNIHNDLRKLSLEHPTRGGHADWAFVCGLVSSGKILLDTSKLLLYKNTNWFGSQEHISKQVKNLYKKSGLSERGSLFEDLLSAIDSFIFVARKTSPVDRKEIIDAGKYIFKSNVISFCKKYNQEPYKFTEEEGKVIQKLQNTEQFEISLDLSLKIIELLKSDLVPKYLNFYKKSLEIEWGTIE